MDKSQEVTNMMNEPTESTSSDQVKISFDMQRNSVKQESDCLVSGINIKSEPQEDESEFRVIAGTSYDMCPDYNNTIETETSFIKIEYKYLENEIMQDPSNVDSKIKVEEHFLVDSHQSEPRIKNEPIERKKDKKFLEINKNSVSHGSSSNQGQDQLLVSDDPYPKNKKYVCNECNKAFRQRCNLNDHLRIHIGAKPFECGVCEKSFTTKGNLDRHMLIHSGDKPHVCDVCQKAFNQKATLNSHMFIHSGKKTFPCLECNKSFTIKRHLVLHTRIHTGEKPYSCDLCKKAFVQKSDLTRHTRTHTGEKPYSCDICNKLFAHKINLKQHKKNHKY